MSTYTPGPWIIKGRVGESEIYDSEGVPIAGPRFVYGNDKEGMANANLISAAPDLLEAVILQNDAINKLLGRFGDIPSASELLTMALLAGTAAIKKAKGGK